MSVSKCGAVVVYSPDDFSRVVLAEPDTEGNDYINASFVDVGLLLPHVHITNHAFNMFPVTDT